MVSNRPVWLVCGPELLKILFPAYGEHSWTVCIINYLPGFLNNVRHFFVCCFTQAFQFLEDLISLEWDGGIESCKKSLNLQNQCCSIKPISKGSWYLLSCRRLRLDQPISTCNPPADVFVILYVSSKLSQCTNNSGIHPSVSFEFL